MPVGVVDQAIVAIKIKAAEERLAFLRSLLVPVAPRADEVPSIGDEPIKRGPGRPKKAA